MSASRRAPTPSHPATDGASRLLDLVVGPDAGPRPHDGRVDASRLVGLPGVQEVIHVSQPYKQVSREWKNDPTVVKLPGGVAIGATEVVAIAGPCSVENERQIQLQLTGPDAGELDRIATTIADRIRPIPGVVDVGLSSKGQRPEIGWSTTRLSGVLPLSQAAISTGSFAVEPA